MDVSPDWRESTDIAKTVVAELLNIDPLNPVEIGIDRGSRFTFELESSPYPPNPQINISLNQSDVVVVTGGARGVTASCALALAKHVKPTIVLFGRSPYPLPEPEWLVHTKGEAAVKRAILENEFSGNSASPKQIEHAYQKHMANREIEKNLNKLKSTGATVHYYPVDIRNKDEMQKVLDKIRST